MEELGFGWGKQFVLNDQYRYALYLKSFEIPSSTSFLPSSKPMSSVPPSSLQKNR